MNRYQEHHNTEKITTGKVEDNGIFYFKFTTDLNQDPTTLRWTFLTEGRDFEIDKSFFSKPEIRVTRPSELVGVSQKQWEVYYSVQHAAEKYGEVYRALTGEINIKVKVSGLLKKDPINTDVWDCEHMTTPPESVNKTEDVDVAYTTPDQVTFEVKVHEKDAASFLSLISANMTGYSVERKKKN